LTIAVVTSLDERRDHAIAAYHRGSERNSDLLDALPDHGDFCRTGRHHLAAAQAVHPHDQRLADRSHGHIDGRALALRLQRARLIGQHTGRERNGVVDPARDEQLIDRYAVSRVDLYAGMRGRVGTGDEEEEE